MQSTQRVIKTMSAENKSSLNIFKIVFQNTSKDLLELFLALWRLMNKQTLYAVF